MPTVSRIKHNFLCHIQSLLLVLKKPPDGSHSFVTAPVYHAIFTTALYTGMRRGELLGLKWEDVDFDAGTIHVRRNLIYDDEGFRFGTLKTESLERDITIEDYLVECLKSYRIKQLEVKMSLGKSYERWQTDLSSYLN
ncbi:site-specific integrase [Bacillus safensis]|uniref:site-specific integrase n=1 Tax=Bacillus safensis TaxID=561879 RepID=UPI003000C3A3